MQYWRKMYKFSLHATEFSVFGTRSRIWVRLLCHFPRLSKQTRWKIHFGPVKNKHDVKANNTSPPDLPQRDRHSFQHGGDTKRRKNANKNNFKTNWRLKRWKFKLPSVGQSVNAQGNMGRGKRYFSPSPRLPIPFWRLPHRLGKGEGISTVCESVSWLLSKTFTAWGNACLPPSFHLLSFIP